MLGETSGTTKSFPTVLGICTATPAETRERHKDHERDADFPPGFLSRGARRLSSPTGAVTSACDRAAALCFGQPHNASAMRAAARAAPSASTSR